MRKSNSKKIQKELVQIVNTGEPSLCVPDGVQRVRIIKNM